MATTQDKDEKESPKKKAGKDLDDLKKEVPIVRVKPKPLFSTNVDLDCVIDKYNSCSNSFYFLVARFMQTALLNFISST